MVLFEKHIPTRNSFSNSRGVTLLGAWSLWVTNFVLWYLVHSRKRKPTTYFQHNDVSYIKYVLVY